MSYIGTEPKDIRSFGRTKFDYTATQGQTAFTGADDDGKVLAFTVGQIEVYVNGILMDDSDFTTTGTGTVTLASAANLNDVVNIVSFESNIPDNDYVPASGGTFTGAVTASNGLTVDDDGATPLTVDRATSSGTTIDVQKDGTSMATIGSSGSAGTIVLNTSGSSGVGLFGSTNNGGCLLPTDGAASAIDNAKDLGRSDIRWRNIYLSGGVYLGGTGASNKLEDYEEGTYTHTITGSTSGSWTVRSGYTTLAYTKVGRKVTVTGQLETSGTKTASGNCQVSLPFAASSGSQNDSSSAVPLRNPGSTNASTVFAHMSNSHSHFILVAISDSGGITILTDSHLDTAWEFKLHFTYFTDA